VETLDLEDYRYLHSTRAELLRRLGRREEAAASYRRAIELSAEETERRLLERRLGELATGTWSPAAAAKGGVCAKCDYCSCTQEVLLGSAPLRI
jgi:hypothetical protein